MAKDFNIYQWRRQHLVENQVSEEKGSWKKDFKEIMDANDLTKGEIMDFVSIYFKDEKDKPTMVGLNEEALERSKLYPKETLLQFEKVWLPKSLGIEGGTGKESYIALYTKDQIQANLDKIPDEVFHTIMNFGAPIFLKDPSKNKPQPFTMPDDPEVIRAMTRTANNPRGTVD